MAVKVLHPDLAGNGEASRRLEREARALCLLNHPRICTIHDVGREQETPFLVMELLRGETLAARIGRGPLLLAETLTIAEQCWTGWGMRTGRG